MANVFSKFNIMFMSGTPHDYQKNDFGYTNEYINQLDFSLGQSIESKYVAKPILNIIKGSGNKRSNIPYIVKACFLNEMKVKEENNEDWSQIRMLVNLTGIDEIASVQKELIDFYNQYNIVPITIHSTKDDKIGNKINPTIDGKEVKAEDVFTTLENIDDRIEYSDRPVILYQVDMLSEGVNICSFNSVIICTNSDIKMVQQIGRAIRNYYSVDKTKNKIENGHANVYAIEESQFYIVRLLTYFSTFGVKLSDWEWGRCIDVSNSSSIKEDEEDVDKFNKINWEDIADIQIVKYKDLFEGYQDSEYVEEFCNKEFLENNLDSFGLTENELNEWFDNVVDYKNASNKRELDIMRDCNKKLKKDKKSKNPKNNENKNTEETESKVSQKDIETFKDQLKLIRANVNYMQKTLSYLPLKDILMMLFKGNKTLVKIYMTFHNYINKKNNKVNSSISFNYLG